MHKNMRITAKAKQDGLLITSQVNTGVGTATKKAPEAMHDGENQHGKDASLTNEPVWYRCEHVSPRQTCTQRTRPS